PGTFLHGLLELAAAEGFNGESDALTEQVARRCTLRGLSEWTEPLTLWLRQLLRAPLAGTALVDDTAQPEAVCLSALSTYQPELEFWLEASQVDVQKLDRLVQAAVLPDLPRAALLP